MIELQVLNDILDKGSIGILQRNKLTPEYFLSSVDEIAFIINHVQEFGRVPDKATFLSKFPDFDVFHVNEPETYLVTTLREQLLYSKCVPIMKNASEKLKDDAFQFVEYIRGEMRSLTDGMEFLNVGKNLIKDSKIRKDDYLERVARKGLLGIPTGLDWLDELTNGWMGEDLISVGGFLGEGKSYILLFFLWAAWANAKKRPLLISREMGHVMTGFRFDTWNAHFSNKNLISGKTDLGNVVKSVGGQSVDLPLTDTDYVKYLDDLATSDLPDFMLFTNEDNRTCTLDDIETMIDLYKPDIVGIDQLSLIHSNTKHKSIRDKYIEITRELYRMSSRKKVPILLAAQINRDWVKDKKKKSEDMDDAPEMHQFQDSNSVGEDSTRSITFSRRGNLLKMALRKNRYGITGTREFLWDIDRGFINVFDRPEEDEEEGSNDKNSKYKGKGDKEKSSPEKTGRTIKSAEYVF